MHTYLFSQEAAGLDQGHQRPWMSRSPWCWQQGYPNPALCFIAMAVAKLHGAAHSNTWNDSPRANTRQQCAHILLGTHSHAKLAVSLPVSKSSPHSNTYWHDSPRVWQTHTSGCAQATWYALARQPRQYAPVCARVHVSKSSPSIPGDCELLFAPGSYDRWDNMVTSTSEATQKSYR